MAHTERLIEQFVDYFRSSCRPIGERKVGMEVECFVFEGTGTRRVSYFGDTGIGAMLDKLIDDGATPVKKLKGHIFGVDTAEGCVNLESGGQIELSSRPAANLHHLSALWRSHLRRLLSVCNFYNHRLVAGGHDPFSTPEDVDWVPNHGNVERHLMESGEAEVRMGKMTASVHVSLDYSTEEEAIDILRTGYLITPLVSAIFASSPYRQGVNYGFLTERWRTYTLMTDSRSAPFDKLAKRHHRFVDQANELSRLPLMYCPAPVSGSTAGGCSGMNLRELLNTWETDDATEKQLAACMAQVWTDVRLKNIVELRGVDCPEQPFTMAIPALWVGLLYDSENRIKCQELVDRYVEDWDNLFEKTARNGLQTTLRGKQIVDILNILVDLAAKGLKRRKEFDILGRDESRFLDPLSDHLAGHANTAQELLNVFGRTPPPSSYDSILQRLTYVEPRVEPETAQCKHHRLFDLFSAEFGPEAEVKDILAYDATKDVHIIRILDPSDRQVATLIPFGYHHKPTRIGYELRLPKLTTGQDPLEAYLSLLDKNGRRKVRTAFRRLESRMDSGEVEFSWHSPLDTELLEQFVLLHSRAMSHLSRGEPLLSEAIARAGGDALRWLGEDKTVLYARGSVGLLGGAVVRDEGDRYSIMYTAVSPEEKEERGADVQTYIVWLVIKRCLETGRPFAGYGSDPNLYGHHMSIGLLRFKTTLGFRPKARPRSELVKVVDRSVFNMPIVFYEYESTNALTGIVLVHEGVSNEVPGLRAAVPTIRTIEYK